MKKNTAGQAIGAQMVSATDGSNFTGAVTCYVCGDAGTQNVGSVGAGACTHEGNGYHTYAPAQAETNYDLVAFTFVGTGAVSATVQVFTGYPQTGDAFARLGAPAGASVSADIAAIEAQTDDIGVAGAGLTAITGVTLAATQGAITWGQQKIEASVAGEGAVEMSNSLGIGLKIYGFDPGVQIIGDGDGIQVVSSALSISASLSGSVGSVTGDIGGLAAAAQQDVADALKLAPTAGAPAAGSVDAHLDDILTDTGTTLPADVWTYTTRTLTSTAAATTAAVTGAQLNIGITASYAATLSSLTIPATWTKIWFTTKKQLADTDASAALQIVVSNPAAGGTDGVLYVEGAAASVAQRTLGSLTVNQAGGTVAIAIDETLTASLLPRGGEYYDIKCLESGGACTILTEGRAAVGRTVTRAVA